MPRGVVLGCVHILALGHQIHSRERELAAAGELAGIPCAHTKREQHSLPLDSERGDAAFDMVTTARRGDGQHVGRLSIAAARLKSAASMIASASVARLARLVEKKENIK